MVSRKSRLTSTRSLGRAGGWLPEPCAASATGRRAAARPSVAFRGLMVSPRAGPAALAARPSRGSGSPGVLLREHLGGQVEGGIGGGHAAVDRRLEEDLPDLRAGDPVP